MSSKAFVAGGQTLFSAAALITSFLGGLTLVASALESGVFRGARIGDWAWAALIAFGFVGFTTLLILWPWDFGFVMDPVQFVNDAEAAQLEVDDLKGELTGFLWQHWNANQQKLGWLYDLLRLGVVAVVAETVFWILELRGTEFWFLETRGR